MSTRAAKRRDSRYRSGRSRDWIKIKNMTHLLSAMLIALSKRGTPAKLACDDQWIALYRRDDLQADDERRWRAAVGGR